MAAPDDLERDDDAGDATTEPAARHGSGGLLAVGTIVATLLTLFVFLGLSVLAAVRPGAATDPTAAAGPDPQAKLRDLRAKNRAVLDGNEGAAMPLAAATADVLAHAAKANELPFPVPPAAKPEEEKPAAGPAPKPAPPAELKKPAEPPKPAPPPIPPAADAPAGGAAAPAPRATEK